MFTINTFSFSFVCAIFGIVKAIGVCSVISYHQNFVSLDLLSRKDLAKAIETEFESLCTEKQYNPNALEARYAIFNDQIDNLDSLIKQNALLNEDSVIVRDSFRVENISNCSICLCSSCMNVFVD